MTLQGKNIGFALTGSFCTFDIALKEMERLAQAGANIYPIFSDRSAAWDTRFGTSADFLDKATKISGRIPVTTIVEAEKFGPSGVLDLVVIAPCTGNTLAKLALGITDSTVLMAAKGHLRNNKPVLLSIATNDALGANMKNIGTLMNTKYIFFVPFGQDNYKAKPNSMISHFDQLLPSAMEALENRQLQPVIRPSE